MTNNDCFPCHYTVPMILWGLETALQEYQGMQPEATPGEGIREP